MTRRQVRRLGRFSGGVINTARPFAYYRKVFFDKRGATEVLQSLAGEKIVDVGCGLTPWAPDSMFRACHDSGIEFYGIDPAISKSMNFTLRDSLISRATGGSGRYERDAPGTEKALSARAEALPFADGEIDRILSCWLILVWINDERDLFDIFTEFHRVLKPGGSFSLYPLPDWRSLRFKDPDLRRCLQQFHFSQHFVFERFNWQFPPANRVSFVKRAF